MSESNTFYLKSCLPQEEVQEEDYAEEQHRQSASHLSDDRELFQVGAWDGFVERSLKGSKARETWLSGGKPGCCWVRLKRCESETHIAAANTWNESGTHQQDGKEGQVRALAGDVVSMSHRHTAAVSPLWLASLEREKCKSHRKDVVVICGFFLLTSTYRRVLIFWGYIRYSSTVGRSGTAVYLRPPLTLCK